MSVGGGGEGEGGAFKYLVERMLWLINSRDAAAKQCPLSCSTFEIGKGNKRPRSCRWYSRFAPTTFHYFSINPASDSSPTTDGKIDGQVEVLEEMEEMERECG